MTNMGYNPKDNSLDKGNNSRDWMVKLLMHNTGKRKDHGKEIHGKKLTVSATT